jgi:hypothetical protein
MSEPFEFEGDEVTDFTAQLPSATLEAPAAYPRGTLLTLAVQVRVKSVRIDEDRKGGLSRKHMLALEECVVTDVLTPVQRKALIEAAAAVDEELQEEMLPPSADYTVPEEFEPSDDVVVFAHGNEPVGDYEPIEGKTSVADDEDDDAEHSWMDEDEDDTVHTDLAALVGG